ncbi:MAG: hypothetical protein WAT71_02325 [Ignavibacteria bacterium]
MKWLDKIDESGNNILITVGEKNKTTVWNRMSELYLIAEKYLIMKSLENNWFYKDLFLLEELLERNVIKILDYKCHNILEKLKNQPVDNKSFEHLSKLHYINSYLMLQKNNYKGVAENYLASSDYLTISFLKNILQHMTEIYYQKANDVEYQLSISEQLIESIDFEKILSHLKSSNSENYYYILLPYLMCKFIKDPQKNIQFYQEAVDIFINKINNMALLDKNEYYFELINFGIYIRNHYLLINIENIIFELIKRKLKEGLDSELREKNFNLNRFVDYVIIALNVNKFKWVNDFINEYSPLLPPVYKDNEVNMVLAIIEFSKKNYKLTLKHLSNIKKSNETYYILCSKFFFKSNFLIGNYDECFNELERLKKFSDKYKDSPFNTINTTPYLIRVYRSLLKFKSNQTKKNRKELEFLINSEENFSDKPWILEVMKDN